MAYDFFINFGPQIWGDTKDPVQKKTHDSDVLSFTLGTRSEAIHAGTGPGKSGPKPPPVYEVQVAKDEDSATRKIEDALLRRQHIPKCVLLARKSDGGRTTFTRLIMEDCVVTEWRESGTAPGPPPREEFTMKFAKLRIESG